MKPVSLTLDNIEPGCGARQPACIGVPFPQADLRDTHLLCLRVNGVQIACAVTATSHWPDGSVKWGLLEFSVPDCGQSSLELTLSTQSSAVEVKGELSVEQDHAVIEIQVGSLRLQFNKVGDQAFPMVREGSQQSWSSQDIAAVLTSDSVEWNFRRQDTELLQATSISASIVVTGRFVHPISRREINASLTFKIAQDAILTLDYCLHNPDRAQHKEGIWDLGDAGSVFYDQCCIKFQANLPEIELKTQTTGISYGLDNTVDSGVQGPDEMALELFQASSGGDNWQSPNHSNSQGRVPNLYRGYRLQCNGHQLEAADRANPTVWLHNNGDLCWGLAWNGFWQNYPTAISINAQYVLLELFPAQHSDPCELQGGERQSHTITFSFNRNRKSLYWVFNPAVVLINPQTYIDAGVLRDTATDAIHIGYDSLITIGLDAKLGFFSKREQLDEYGWRNFGDVFADHETLYHTSPEPFISHYNNQYDALYGFARQYMLTQDNRWKELMVDLARHVLNIDIYRTEKDRAEYNHGLFWHTDHYKQAFTASHRTYSAAQYPSDWDGEKGGGPGSEHCYTTGLRYYYLLSGDQQARDAVYGLTRWITHFYEGTGTVVERVLLTLRQDLPKLVGLCKRQQVLKYNYPFDRGVGNYIRALLDSFELSTDSSYLHRAEAVIRQTFGASDDITARDLDDIEFTWFYSIFLQEIIRYLDLKREHVQFDDNFHYARAALLHYANWMAEHETPYLSNPDKLEYPNDTWVAQDIRKSNILYSAYLYSGDHGDRLLQRARFFRNYVVEKLHKSETGHFSRILIILMQNHGPGGLMENASTKWQCAPPEPQCKDISCFYSMGSFCHYFLSSWAKCLLRFNPKREYAWLKSRVR